MSDRTSGQPALAASSTARPNGSYSAEEAKTGRAASQRRISASPSSPRGGVASKAIRAPLGPASGPAAGAGNRRRAARRAGGGGALAPPPPAPAGDTPSWR